MTAPESDLRTRLAAWVRHGEAVPPDVTTYDRQIVHDELRALLAATETTPSDVDGEQYGITSLSIAGVQPTYAAPHPERTPIGPFPSREAAWDYAQRMQLQHGNGGGSVDVAALLAPTRLGQVWGRS